MKPVKMSLLLLGCITLMGCGDEGGPPSDPQVRDYSEFFAALPSQPLYPRDNPYNADKERLGELLFWDPVLSGDENVACASCHHPDFGWADGRALSVGSDGVGLGPARFGNQVTPLHSPTILNVAFTGITVQSATEQFVSGGYFWDLRADTLEEQVLGPIQNPLEMLGHNIGEDQILAEIVTRLKAIPEYVEWFDLAFAGEDEPVNSENIARAIATFERKIISPGTRFDRFLSGETAVFSEREVIGLNKFIDGGCARCHSGPMLSDNLLHEGEIIIGDEAFRTPTLRNLSVTAPFMHDGSRASLRDAIADYEDRG